MSDLDARHRGLVAMIRQMYAGHDFVALHAPVFTGNEKRYLLDCIDSTFVSSVGAYVDRFEQMMCELTGARHAIATVNGTAALHLALILAGVRDGDEVITQPLSFVATCNAISYERAHPVFVDVDPDTWSLSPDALDAFLDAYAERRADGVYNKETGRPIRAVVPMHTFGMPGRVRALAEICEAWGLVLVEDAAESLGSWQGQIHTGRIGRLAAFSFNGNKVATSGGGGCIVTDDEVLARRAKHLSTTAKRPHRWDFHHDMVGFNYRLPNINAALACAQLEQLDTFLRNKRETAAIYRTYCADNGFSFFDEYGDGVHSNFWLNAIVMKDRAERDAFLCTSNDAGVMTRPLWILMHRLPSFQSCFKGALPVAEWLEDRVVNVPSSVRP